MPEDWTGTAAQLAQVLIQILPRYTLSPEPQPSERLIRFYVTSGVLLKPQREGREALFGQRQALQFLAARALLEDGWPLAKVATYLQELGDSELIALLPEREVIAPAAPGGGSASAPNRAQQLISRFRKSSAPAPEMPQAQQMPLKKVSTLAAIPLPVPGEEAFKERQSFRAAQREEAAEEPAVRSYEREVRVHITLTPWCEVSLDQDELENLTRSDVESAITRFRVALENELPE